MFPGARLVTLVSALASAACHSPSATWSQDIAPLAERYCTRCHSDLGSGPFSLQSYEEVVRHTQLIATDLDEGQMPPWLPAPGCRPLQGEQDNLLGAQRLAQVAAWIAEGAPEGKPGVLAQVPAVPALGAADRVLELPYDLAGHAGHADHDVRCYKATLGEAAPRQLVAFDVRPTSPKRVMAAGLYRLGASQARSLPEEFECELQPGVPGSLSTSAFGDAALMGIWQSGNGPLRFPEGTGVTLATDDVLVLRVYYHPTAGTGVELTRVDLSFAASPVQSARIVSVADRDFSIPPNSEGYRHQATFTTPGPGLLFAVTPHMKVRGRTLQLSVAGSCALDLVSFSNLWQAGYRFAEGPMGVAGGATVTLGCSWNNSASPFPIGPGDGPGDELCAVTLYWLDGP